ncbi:MULTISPECIES: ATP-binding SpoIIE family protein phosphatase [Streptomyces]|uniref:ATP-binding SpoIIE family protein phosphatase n=1 Tax=Streptomyces TaxID=1883 RepID=UPI0009A09136|nr:serine/threonine protein kinase [Streptomyces sp. WAC00288]
MNPVSGYEVEAEDVVWLRLDVAVAAAARREAARLARRVGMPTDRVAEIELAVTEAATNLEKHARDGALALRVVTLRGRAALELLSVDSGPGMADVGSALTDGVSGSGTLGVGMGAIARFAGVFDVHSLPGRGTALLARFWAGDGTDPFAGTDEPEVAGLTRPISGEEVCGDTWAARTEHGPDGARAVTVMMCDGLGHGPLAALAGERARAAFRAGPHGSPQDVVRALHAELRGSRGAAITVVRADFSRGTVEHCGVGNISAFVVGGDRRSTLLSLPGIVGHQLPALRPFRTPLDRDAVLVLHSDGLSDRWSPADFPGLFTRRPAVVAAQLLGQAGVRRDDAGVVVVRAARG